VNHFCSHIFLLVQLLILVGGSATAQVISIDKENSRLWIEGSSNVNDFSCRAQSYFTKVESAAERDTAIEVEVDIEVESFDCGKRRMNRDLYETLLSDRHPHISFEFIRTESMTFNDTLDIYKLTVTGKLRVAGHTREITFPLEAVMQNDGTLKATGNTVMLMTDFNVEPPRALMGLVRVDNKLTVHFELYAKSQNGAFIQNE